MTTILRYYQTLLKSIPATITKAEDQLITKEKLTTALPEAKNALTSLIREQQALAEKIEKHTAFFIKYDQKTELGLPKPLKESLRQMPAKINTYVELLKLQTDALNTKDTLTYFGLSDQEQQLFEEINQLFDKPIYTEPKKSALYNLARALGKAVMSPISKALITITMTIIITFPSILMPSSPVIQPRQSTSIIAPIVNAESFANSMRKHGWRIRVLKSTPDKPTIIIKEDEHGTPEFELKFVNQAFTEHNINLLAIEGWAGYEQDAERGRTVLNAEEDFIKIMLQDLRFHKEGLENAELQEEALKMCIFQTLQYITSQLKIFETDITQYQKQIKELEQKKNELATKITTASKTEQQDVLDTIKNIDREIESINIFLQSRIKSQTLFNQLKERMPQTFREDLEEFGMTIQELEEAYSYLLEKDISEITQIKEKICVIKRSELWAQKVAVLASRFKSLIIVMGCGHTESFLNKLNQIGEYNIVIVAPYPQ
ncbi:hypothetical protein KY319_04970 [Candidatus Woesearchaeota archaeon]|nr:hypothetical protein [Candidatus Woesearchaeota archaeon]